MINVRLLLSGDEPSPKATNDRRPSTTKRKWPHCYPANHRRERPLPASERRRDDRPNEHEETIDDQMNDEETKLALLGQATSQRIKDPRDANQRPQQKANKGIGNKPKKGIGEVGRNGKGTSTNHPPIYPLRSHQIHHSAKSGQPSTEQLEPPPQRSTPSNAGSPNKMKVESGKRKAGTCSRCLTERPKEAGGHRACDSRRSKEKEKTGTTRKRGNPAKKRRGRKFSRITDGARRTARHFSRGTANDVNKNRGEEISPEDRRLQIDSVWAKEIVRDAMEKKRAENILIGTDPRRKEDNCAHRPEPKPKTGFFWPKNRNQKPVFFGPKTETENRFFLAQKPKPKPGFLAKN
uniref:Uncharacterized protein n=1 Tax=Globodera rostochiensis TaxID=31243 RepID=A0A914IEZ1_GLORO